jgi:methyl-accepting chemotaxis protein
MFRFDTILKALDCRTKEINKHILRMLVKMSELTDAVATLQTAVQGVSDRVAALSVPTTDPAVAQQVADLTAQLADSTQAASDSAAAIADAATQLDAIAPTTGQNPTGDVITDQSTP